MNTSTPCRSRRRRDALPGMRTRRLLHPPARPLCAPRRTLARQSVQRSLLGRMRRRPHQQGHPPSQRCVPGPPTTPPATQRRSLTNALVIPLTHVRTRTALSPARPCDGRAHPCDRGQCSQAARRRLPFTRCPCRLRPRGGRARPTGSTTRGDRGLQQLPGAGTVCGMARIDASARIPIRHYRRPNRSDPHRPLVYPAGDGADPTAGRVEGVSVSPTCLRSGPRSGGLVFSRAAQTQKSRGFAKCPTSDIISENGRQYGRPG